MNPFQLISDLKIEEITKAQLVLLFSDLGISAVRVDIYSNGTNDSPDFVKGTLTQARLHFQELKTSATDGSHLAGLGVALTKNVAFDFRAAIEEKQYPTQQKMIGYPCSAIEAANEPSLQLRSNQYPLDMVDNPFVFALSIKGKDEEAELVRARMKFVEEHAPNVFKKVYMAIV